MQATEQDCNVDRQITGLNALKVLSAFRECSAEMQECALSMVEVLTSPDIDQDEYDRAMNTLVDCLYPERHNDKIGIDLEDIDEHAAKDQPEVPEIANRLDEQERDFAERLDSKMTEKGITQSQLAERAGVGQPAISMMLKRACRPQQRTINKLSEALGINPKELWPFSE